MSTAALPLPTTRRPESTVTRGLRLYASETRFEFLRLLRTRAFSFSVIGFPAMFYTLFGLMLNRGEHIGGLTVARYLLGGYSVFGTVGAALFGVGVGLAMDFSAGWLELKRASPLPPMAYLLAKCTTAIAFGLIILTVLCGLGIEFGHVSLSLADYTRLAGMTILGAIPFASLGLLLAMVLPPNSAPGMTNLISLPMSFLGGLWLPVTQLPKALQAFAPALPTYHVGQLMLRALGYPAAGSLWGHAMYIIGFTLVMLGSASLLFHRRENHA